MTTTICDGDDKFEVYHRAWRYNGEPRTIIMDDYVWLAVTDNDDEVRFIQLPRRASLIDSYYGPEAILARPESMEQ